MDANGHIGRDGIGGVGTKGMEYWIFNGTQLQELTNDNNLTILDTLQNCDNAGYTWQRRDGKGKGRIDYLLVETCMVGSITKNKLSLIHI